MIRNLEILRVYLNMFYIGLVYGTQKHFFYKTRKLFEKYDGRKVQLSCIANNLKNQYNYRLLQIDNDIKLHAFYQSFICI